MMRVSRLVICLGVLSMILSAPCSALQYQVTALSPLDGYTSSVAFGVNDSGVAVGVSAVGSPFAAGAPSRACIWNSTGVHELAPLPGYSYSGAYRTNNSGVAVGYSTNGDFTQGRACYWDAFGVHDLGSVFTSGTRSIACDVDEQGHILVNTRTSTGSLGESYMWDGSMMNPIVAAGWQVTGCNATNNGVTAGTAWPLSGGSPPTACYWDQTGFHPLQILQADYNTGAYDVNDRGTIVGTSYYPYGDSYATTRACLWDDTGVHDLGFSQGHKGATAMGINERGMVVGRSYMSGPTSLPRAVFWDGGAPEILPMLPNLSNGTAESVNEGDWIAGYFINGTFPSTSTTVACLWTPVPEPASLMALLGGLAGLAMRRRRMR